MQNMNICPVGTSFVENMSRDNCHLTDLRIAICEISDGEIASAVARIHRIFTATSRGTHPHDRLAHIFAQALSQRLKGGHTGGNIYQTTEGDMLAAFQVLCEYTPLIRFGHDIANKALLLALEGTATPIHLIDVGIGMGSQWTAFLREWASHVGNSHSIHLTGIDVPDADQTTCKHLGAVGKALGIVANQHSLSFGYSGISGAIETLEDLPLIAGKPLGINAAFALHHTPAHMRDAVIQRLCALNPRIITLVEPDSDHNQEDFACRVSDALLHYSIVFDILDDRLRRHPRERFTLENHFFGREIHNVVACDGRNRTERHERGQQWSQRMHHHGMIPWWTSDNVGEIASCVSFEPPFSIITEGDGISLSWKGDSIITVSAWRPKPL